MVTCCKASGKARASKRTSLARKCLVFPFIVIIRIYQYFISPLLGPKCRFEPTCSHYAEQCLQQHGIIFGVYLAIKRLLKCHPWHPGGYDPVPSPPHNRNS